MAHYNDKLHQIREKYYGDNLPRNRPASHHPTIRGSSTIRQDTDLKPYYLDKNIPYEGEVQTRKAYRAKQIDAIRDNFAQARKRVIEDYTHQNKTIDLDREIGRIHHREYTFNKLPEDHHPYPKQQLTQTNQYSKALEKAYEFGKTLGYQVNNELYKRPQLTDYKYDLPPREPYDYKYQQIKKDMDKDRSTDPRLNFGKQMTNINDRIHSIASKYGYQYPETFSPTKKHPFSTDIQELKVSGYLKSPIKIEDDKYKHLQLQLRNRRTSISAYGINKPQYHESPVKKGFYNENNNPEWGVKNMEKMQGKINYLLETKQKY